MMADTPPHINHSAEQSARNLSTDSLRRRILSLLGPSPTPEDQLTRDLALPGHQIAEELLALELDGEVARQPGGMLTRAQ